MDTLIDIVVYLTKLFGFVLAILFLASGLMSLAQRDKKAGKDRLKVTLLNDKYRQLAQSISKAVNAKKVFKKELKELAKQQKAHEKAKLASDDSIKRVYVIDFKGDIRAAAAENLRHEITGLLKVARPQDEIVCRLESPGGLVHAYGLAASQLARIRQQQIPLTVCVDKVAASGGYLMAAVANHITAAPYAIIGSIGVVAQFPNFNRLLKKHYVDYELITAGEYKRTLSILGPNTSQNRKKFTEELETIHTQFKNTISQFRPQIDISKVATGEHWLAEKAFDLNLVDSLCTSDDYLLKLAEQCDIYHVEYKDKKKLTDKFVQASQQITSAVYHKALEHQRRWWS